MPDLNALLRKAEMQHTQLELELRFKKNMEVFKRLHPSVYNEYINYTPHDLKLSYDEKGYINLVNHKLNNKPVYREDPRDHACKQTAEFCQRPTVSTLEFTKSKPYNRRHFHIELINEVLDKEIDPSPSHEDLTQSPIGYLLVTGCGLGYHIEELIQQLDIYSLCIFDPHKDSFYASLHTIDWIPILQYFTRPNRMLSLCIGRSPEDTMVQIKLNTGKIGVHNTVYSYIFRHFNSVEEQKFIEVYKRQFHLNAFGLGFTEDEQISLAHTVHNLNHRIPLLSRPGSTANLPPAFIIGNGPSLDEMRDFMAENIDNAIVFSCGTTASSLCRMGIKPDFQVEMERTQNPKKWLELGTTAEFRQGIIALGLNNVHPGVYGLFERSYMAVKPNDLGELIIQRESEGREHPNLAFCNPTVTNCALSLAITLGFRQIYLLGVDLGMLDTRNHHAKVSVHYDVESEDNKVQYGYLDNQHTTKGNFVDEVFTEPVLDSSRINMETIIRHVAGMTVYNPNNGARIEGATPCKVEDLPRPPKLAHKQQAIDDLLNSCYEVLDIDTLTDERVSKRYLASFYKLRKHLNLPETVVDKQELYLAMNDIYARINAEEAVNPISTLLLRGSISSYFSLISKYCTCSADLEELRRNYLIVKERYDKFLNCAYKMIREEGLRLDDTVPNWG